MSDWRPKDRPPPTVGTLQRWIGDHARATGLAVPRLQRRISYMAVAGALDRVRADDGGPSFVIKGGVAMELRDPSRARATRDLDATYRAGVENSASMLAAAFAAPLGDFAFLVSGSPYVQPAIGLIVADVRVQYRGRAFQKVKLELTPAESTDVGAIEYVPAFDIGEYGIDDPELVACLPLAEQMAQKFHACTVGHGATSRARDLMDIIIIRDMVQSDQLASICRACERVFTERAGGVWPPAVVVHDEWADGFAEAIRDLGFPITNVSAAVDLVRAIIVELVAAQ